jgi:hypothetical protein
MLAHREGHVGTIPTPRDPVRRLPPGVTQTRHVGRAFQPDAAPSSGWKARPPSLLTDASTTRAWPRGGAVCARPRPLASPGDDRPEAPLTRGLRRSEIFHNSVVGHTRIIHLRVARGPRGPRVMREVSGTLHTTVQQSTPGPARRDVARRRQNEPLRITIIAEEPARGRVARRRRRMDLRQPVGGPRGSRGGPIGVVKLLRARGGCLGVIRFGRGRLR